jgi:transposase-like protein
MPRSEPLKFPSASGLPITHWFSSRGSVVVRGKTTEVFVGGTLIGSYEEGEQLERNAILVQLATDPMCHLGRLAEAFGMSTERLRQLRREYEAGGVEALRPGSAGGPRRLSEREIARLTQAFEKGLAPTAAHAAMKGVSLSTVRRAHRAWRAARATKPEAEVAVRGPAASRTMPLPGIDMLPTPRSADAEHAEDDAFDLFRRSPLVQHAGAWIMTAMLARFGVYDVVGEVASGRADNDAVRVALDATIASFAIGEHTLEGVRRLATPTANLLLQTPSVPSPDTLRLLMDDLSVDLGAVAIHLQMLRRYLDADRQLMTREPGVFYVDAHVRTYTGKHVIRKGWRMQDRRVRPGVSDYYVHDADGRPLLRIDVPSHDSLSMWMMPIVVQLRAVVGDDDRMLVAFDRGGAYPETMATLREAGCEFVTYERAPYPKLSAAAFSSEVTFDVGERAETLRFVEAARTNLKKGRGRVRRISVLDADGHQINLLASSTLSPERLIAIMRGRWWQENGFKHGNERWGINHLDARKVVPVDPDEVMPNPARRRLDIARRAANVREGDARNKLVRLDEDNPRYAQALRAVAEAMLAEQEIDALRPSVPKYARVGDTELAGKLVKHDGRRKLLLDTLRIACANAESDLAQMLATGMTRPREAKKLLSNILRAPAKVRVGTTIISVDLAPAATGAEAEAITEFLEDLSSLDLHLPGDPRRRKLRFKSQLR